MEQIFKYTTECNSLYNVVALLILCTLLGFISWLCYKVIISFGKLIQYIVNKIAKYKEIHTKAQYRDASLEIDLQQNQDEMGTE